MQPRVTIGMTAFNRPELLREAIHAIYRNPGEEFELILYMNGPNDKTVETVAELHKQYKFQRMVSDNIGQQAIRKMIDRTQTKYFLMIEDDMIWFTDNWLKELVDAMEINPSPTPIKGTKEEWGILTTNCLQDRVTNGALWPVHFQDGEFIDKTYGDIDYIVTGFAAGGPILMRTEVAKELDAFTADCPLFEGEVDMALHRYRQAQYPMAHVKSVYTYHANSPFFNEPYPEVWRAKQGEQTIEEAKELYKREDDRFDFNYQDNHLIWDYIKSGTFQDYAKQVWQNRKI